MERKSLQDAVEYAEDKFTKRILFKKDDSVAFVLNFLPGQELPVHKHPQADVYILALVGNGTLTINGEESALHQGDVINVNGDEDFSYRNSGSAPASLYVILSHIPTPDYAKKI
ncbi:cupin domain-containing protein [Gorillibacterium massiliense]|uniref:cupin domain-containing protein n=1 Tax=Gorillibacterium massiliense TaxID=1280390 RepID=UPI0004AEE8E9|nr:cupin domain-containing protein [Gorillibacterium massiliense]